MIRERFRTNYNIYGNSTSDEAGSNLESELETPFNIHMLHIAKQESYPAYVRNLDESTSLQPETNLFEDKLEQESPFRITQYTESDVAGTSRKPVISQSSKVKIIPFSIVVKTFIDKPIELVYKGGKFPPGFDRNKGLALVDAIDKQFSENPMDDKKDKKYRIYSRQNFQISVVDTEIVAVDVSCIDSDIGIEKGPLGLSLNGKSGIWMSKVKMVDRTNIEFLWEIDARLGLDPITKQTYNDIYNKERPGLMWHGVSGIISPSSGIVKVEGRGSAFPRHKIWVNGKLSSVSSFQSDISGSLWERASYDSSLHRFDRIVSIGTFKTIP